MAKIEVQKVVRKLRLGDYAPEYEDEGIGVWVNPTRAERDAWVEIRLELAECQDELGKLMDEGGRRKDEGGEEEKEGAMGTSRGEEVVAYGRRVEAANEAVWGWFARMWSQGKDAAGHWTMEEVQELAAKLMEDDPAMWTWLMRRTHEMQAEYRAGAKKK